MAENDIEAITVSFAAQCLDETRVKKEIITKLSSSDSSHESVKKSSGRKPVREQGQPTNVTNEDTATSNSIRERKDSHSEEHNENSTSKLSEVDTIESELKKSKHKNKELENKIEKYRAKWKKAHSENHQMKDEMRKKEAELENCQQELECLKQRNHQLQCDYGTEDINFERTSVAFNDIHFKRVYNRRDNSAEVTMKATFKVSLYKIFRFPEKEWRKDDVTYKGVDKGAVSSVYISRKLYLAKCGKEQKDFQEFIDKTHYTRAVISLSNVIESPLAWKWAQHAELQLIALYLERILEPPMFDMADIYNVEAYKTCPELVTPVTIYVDQKTCESCLSFIEKINGITKQYGLSFAVVNNDLSC